MGYKQSLTSDFNTKVSNLSVKNGSGKKLLRRDLERGRKTILSGWIISMIGIVTYCFVMLNGDQQIDLLGELSARVAIGWVSLVFILMGVGFWFVGCVRFLDDADSSTAEADEQ